MQLHAISFDTRSEHIARRKRHTAVRIRLFVLCDGGGRIRLISRVCASHVEWPADWHDTWRDAEVDVLIDSLRQTNGATLKTRRVM